MKPYVVILLISIAMASSAYAVSDSVSIGPTPTIRNASAALEKSLRVLRGRVESDARNCLENAQGMESSANYKAYLKKTLDTKKIVVLEVSGTMICDGVHSSSYRYGISFEKTTGKRFDLNMIYDIAIRSDERLFLRPELSDPVKVSYRLANVNNPSCLENTGWVEGLTNYPLTFSPQPDGSLNLYYAAPDISATCFPILRLDRSAVARYRDAGQAVKYGLP